MDIRYAGGETRESVHCKNCGTKEKPLRWRSLLTLWLCDPCCDEQVEKAVETL